MFVCCVLSDRCLCDELITHPEESYRLWTVVVCNHITSWYEEAIAHAGLQSQRNKQQTYNTTLLLNIFQRTHHKKSPMAKTSNRLTKWV
jgi:hypothetical protein